jgi:hypothetical protein
MEYASALLAIQSLNKPQKIFALPATGRFDLLHRIELIMGIRAKQAFTKHHFLSLFFAIVVIVSSFYLTSNKQPHNALISYATFANDKAPTVVNWVSENNGMPASNYSKGKRIIIHQKPSKQNQVVIIPFVKHTLYTPPIINYNSSSNNILAANYQLRETAAFSIKNYQHKQVKEAIASSKKVVTDIQWKAIEKDLAEVFTPVEKAELKKMYEKELVKIDWKKWEEKLSESYNKIDWNNVNTQLNIAVNNIRIDSIQQVYNVALSKLAKVEKLMAENEMAALPDTDITPELIQRKKKEALEVLRKITAIKKKKIVHL